MKLLLSRFVFFAVLALCAALLLGGCTAASGLQSDSAYKKGTELLAAGDTQAAAEAFSQAIAANPQFVEALQARGELAYQQQDWDKALADFESALALQPDNARLQYLSSLILIGKDQG